MHIVAYVFRRVPGMTTKEFHHYYENIHGPRMVELLRNRGLISYDHYPVRPAGIGDPYLPDEGPAYDALSIYVFENAEAAAAAWPIPELVEDSRNFCHFESMVTLPLAHRRVYPS
jgi:hypothetical protein